MLNVAQKAMLIAFGRIIADIEPHISVASFIFDGRETFKVTVSDGPGAIHSWFSFEGCGSTLSAAVEEVIQQFERHSMGTGRENVEAWINAGCPSIEDEAPDTVRQPLLLDLSAFNDENDIDVAVWPATNGVVRGGTRAKDMDPGPGRRFMKRVATRKERLAVRAVLRNGID